MSFLFTLPPIPTEERTPLVELLLGIIAAQAEQIQRAKEQIQALSDEIAILKGLKPKPKIPKSSLEGDESQEGKGKPSGGEKRHGSAKRSKTEELAIHSTVTLVPAGITDDWIFKGYNDFIVQGLMIDSHNTKYRRGRWLTPAGETVMAPLPPEVSGHFSATLISYVQHQYFACRVTQPLLLEQLREIGIDISSGQLNAILSENKDDFHSEKNELFQAGLLASSYIQVDDTGARHQGKNGYSTCLSNEFFAYFSSGKSKSRINFLEILRASFTDYIVNADAVAYMQQQTNNKRMIALLTNEPEQCFLSQEAWLEHLTNLGITGNRHVRVATEGALLASAIAHGLRPEMVVLRMRLTVAGS